MQSVKLISLISLVATIASSFTPKNIVTTEDTNDPADSLTGQWIMFWSNSKATTVDTKIVWSLRESNLGTETITLSGKGNGDITVVQFPITWKTTTTAAGLTFFKLAYGEGKMLKDSNITVTTGKSVFDMATALIHKKSDTQLSIQYWLYSDENLCLNNYLDGEPVTSTITRLRMKKTR